MFRGWPAEAIEFYEGLEADNTRAYWVDHKKEYEELVKGPMVELLGELEGDYGAGKIFRPFRDTRFSRDKTPYKTAIGATLERGGYVQFSAHGLAAGSGYYVMMPDQLDNFRRAVDGDTTGAALERLVAGLRQAKIDVTARESLKTAPRGYPKDHPRIELLRYKGLIAWKQWDVAAWMGTARAKQRVVDFLEAARPLTAWLDRHVGPSELPPR
ncbi:MAG TPA: DUF2461 domain-containing protein [Acidimicrobiia bacterium]|nr:DUF2461 domain-containing protein [Acidimicrobiia bacterium]